MRFADLLQKQPDSFFFFYPLRGICFLNVECKIGRFETAFSQAKLYGLKLNSIVFYNCTFVSLPSTVALKCLSI